MVGPQPSRSDVLRFRFRRHGLDTAPGAARDVDLLDYGVQDTGPDGAAWALTVRGAAAELTDDLALAWTLRAAPHAYRRRDLAAITVATAPFSEADARSRVFDASKPLLATGIDVLDALGTIARHMREVVRSPTVKGEVSRRLAELLDAPYLRACRQCHATHAYENPFRLAALQAGLELEPGTSPPVLRRIPRLRPAMYGRAGDAAEARFDVVRSYVRFYGPARPKDAAAFLDAPVKVVAEHWPEDVAEVEVSGTASGPRGRSGSVLTEDLDELGRADAGGEDAVRLLGPYDPYLQLRDRELLVPDAARRKALWPVLGRPGAVVSGGEVLATWRPRTSGRRLTVAVEPWGRLPAATRALVGQEAERLAAHRGVTLAAVDVG